jgi:hypothetical protein
MEQRSVEGENALNVAAVALAPDNDGNPINDSIVDKDGKNKLDLNSLEGIAAALEVSTHNVFAFSEAVIPFAFDPVENESHSNHNSLENDDEDEDGGDDTQVSEMQKENAEILKKMSMLMKNMNKKPVVQEQTRIQRQPMNSVKVEKLKREDYGLDVSKMKSWQEERKEKLMEEEEHRQEIAVARVRGFLDAIRMLTRLQCWWRMMHFKMEFKAFRNARLEIKGKFYNAWKQHWKAEHMFLYQRIGKIFEAWAAEVQNSKTLKEIVKSFYAL